VGLLVAKGFVPRVSLQGFFWKTSRGHEEMEEDGIGTTVFDVDIMFRGSTMAVSGQILVLTSNKPIFAIIKVPIILDSLPYVHDLFVP
jgi:hypothetical protein